MKRGKKIKGLNNGRTRELAAPQGLKSCRCNQPNGYYIVYTYINIYCPEAATISDVCFIRPRRRSRLGTTIII